MSDNPHEFDARLTYDAASRDYDDASRDYWQFLSERAVDLARLQPGERVLDVPCGTGPATIAAATQVGPSGYVLGVDFAQQMLDIAKEHVDEHRLHNVELKAGDMTALGLPPDSFDAVVCVLGVFFVEDMAAVTRALWELLRPGEGRLVIGALGRQFFDPMRDVFVDAVASVRADVEVQQPWLRTEDPDVLRSVFEDAGITDVAITTSVDVLPFSSPDEWWRIVRGTGLRRVIMGLEPHEERAVRERCDAYMREHDITSGALGTHLAIAHRQSGAS